MHVVSFIFSYRLPANIWLQVFLQNGGKKLNAMCDISFIKT